MVEEVPVRNLISASKCSLDIMDNSPPLSPLSLRLCSSWNTGDCNLWTVADPYDFRPKGDQVSWACIALLASLPGMRCLPLLFTIIHCELLIKEFIIQ